MKSRAFILLFILGLVLFIGIVSAGLFSNLFKATGKVTWQIEDPTGVCVANDADPLFRSNTFLNSSCNLVDNSVTCNDLSGCSWNNGFEEFLDKEINVTEGWNLIMGLLFPSQISEGDISPDNIKVGYVLDVFDKQYYQLYPEWAGHVWGGSGGPDYEWYISTQGTSLVMWIYFNKSGSFKFRSHIGLEKGELDGGKLNNPLLIKGWNLMGINPAMFYDLDGVKQNSFTLNDVKGSCNIEDAYLFTTQEGTSGEWESTGLNDSISDNYLMKGLAVKVSSDCILGKVKPGFECIMTEGPRIDVQGTVNLSQNGNIINSETDSCIGEGENVLIVVNQCSFSADGTVTIQQNQVPCFGGFDQMGTCDNGVCIRKSDYI